MIAAPLSRMFWKEYRQQRTLWLAVLAAGLAVQLVLRVLVGVDPKVLEVVWGAPLVMAMFYLPGSAAMLFALEREERTSDWLLSLAAPPGWTLLAKYSFAIISTVALCAAMWLWALVLSVGVPLQLPLPPELNNGRMSVAWMLIAGCLTAGMVALFLLGWGALGSLTSRRVIVALPAGMLWWFLMMLLPLLMIANMFDANSFDGLRPQLETFVMGAACVAVVVADVWLGWRWCQGKYLDAHFFDDLHERLLERLKWRTARTARIPVVIESEHSGWRVWQRLVWQERHRESFHSAMLWIACGVSVFLAIYSSVRRESITIGMLPLIVPLPLAMGLFGFSFDAAGQQLRFLANRGTSPLAIWFSKHAVWLPRAFWIPLVVSAVSILAEGTLVPSNASGVMVSHHNGLVRPLSPGVDVNHPLRAMSLDAWQYSGDVLWFVLLGYAVGQLCSMLLRKVVLAAAAGLILNSLFVGWLWLMMVLDVPRWWSVGSLVVWMLCVTWWYSRPWLMEQQSWRIWWRVAAGLLLPPLLLVGAVATYRVLEVPGFGPMSTTLFALLHPREYQRRQPMLKFGDSLTDRGLMTTIEKLKQPISPDDHAASMRLTELMGNFNTGQMFRESLEGLDAHGGVALPGLPPGMMGVGLLPEGIATVEADPPADALQATRDQRARDAFWAANEPVLKVILEVAQRESCGSPNRWLDVGSVEKLMPQQRLLLEAARLRNEDGLLGEALDYYCASLRLATFWARSGGLFDGWHEGAHQQAVTLQAIVDWANHPDQTPDSLLLAMGRIKAELERFPSAREAVVAQYVEDSNRFVALLNSSPAALRAATPREAFDSMLAFAIPVEAARLQRLLEQQVFWRYQALGILTNLMNQPGVDAPRHYLERQQQDTGLLNDERFRRTTLFAHVIREVFDPEMLRLIVNRETVVRESLVALALLAWKRDHGAWPEGIGQLSKYSITKPEDAAQANGDNPGRQLSPPLISLYDPWNGGFFEYNGAILNNHPQFKEDYAVLATVGPEHLRMVMVESTANGLGWEPRTVPARGDVSGMASTPIRLIVRDGKLSLRLP